MFWVLVPIAGGALFTNDCRRRFRNDALAQRTDFVEDLAAS
jgi:hypothetical protein